MSEITAPTCPHCGASLMEPAVYCPYCRHPLTALFADLRKVETCNQFLKKMNARLVELPPGAGWAMLALWFGVPIAALAGCVVLLDGWLGWLVGLVVALLLFCILVVAVAGLREQERLRRQVQEIQPAIAAFIRSQPVDLVDLILLADSDESLRNSNIAAILRNLRLQ